MNSNIETLLKESITLAEVKFKEDSTLQQFERANEGFKKLVQKGLAHERGNNLLSISDTKSITRVIFNAY